MSGAASIATHEIVRELMQEAASAVAGHKFGLHFLLTEWEQVVDAWQLEIGRLIAMSCASGERHGYRKRSAKCCGPSSSGCVPVCNRAS